MVRISQNGFDCNVALQQLDSIEWIVSECVGRFVTHQMPGAYYWCALGRYSSPPGTPREFVLESGILHDKVKAFTQARKRARFFRRERYSEQEAQKKSARLIPGMKGWQ